MTTTHAQPPQFIGLEPALKRVTTRVLPAMIILVAAFLTPSVKAAAAASYSEPVQTAIGDLTVATEHRDGYERDKFKIWIDADDDGCDTRDEVLISEADDAPEIGSGCSLTGGRWYSYYDGVSHTSKSEVDIDHVVPLAEAWDSGAGEWTADRREAYANDLDDYRTLIAVTDSVNQSKSDQDLAEWLPEKQQCRYLREYVAVKIRWTLTVDSAEKSAMDDLAGSCTNSTISVDIV